MFTLELPTTFLSYSPLIEIFDERGMIFYERENEGAQYFNLPVGTYQTESEIIPCEDFLNYPLPKAYRPEHDCYRYVNEIGIDFRETPHVAFIEIDKRRKKADVCVDPSVMDLPDYCFNFVCEHELGHLRFRTEKKCDRFASINMLKRGFNPSQIFSASLLTLNKEKSNGRIDAVRWAMMETSNKTFAYMDALTNT